MTAARFFKYLSMAIAVTVIFGKQQTVAECGKCGPNGVACISSTTYYDCLGDVPVTSYTTHCPEATICVSSGAICIDAAMGVQPECDHTGGCSKCDGNRLFTCTSRTTFAMCIGDEVKNVHHSCPPHLFCDSRNAEICVDECHLTFDKPECGLVEPPSWS
uniref:Chitin-binding type-2 domain-containing protein n=1 Tax=Stomoxys calcitrans TaxID=35570 RepID=A0A1I8QE51_STOCA